MLLAQRVPKDEAGSKSCLLLLLVLLRNVPAARTPGVFYGCMIELLHELIYQNLPKR